MRGTLATPEASTGHLSIAEQASSIHARKKRLESLEMAPTRPRDPMAPSGCRSLARSITQCVSFQLC
jgi:hypothetical protein